MTDRKERTGVAAGRFWRRRECWVPTWRTVSAAGLGLVLSVVGLFLGVHPFLAVTRPLHAEVLAVEGWCDDAVLEFALAEFGRGHYSRLVVTGGPVHKGAVLSDFPTYAEMGAATLRKLAPPATPIVAVPTLKADRDRTYSAALALRRWLVAQGPPPAGVNLVTVGPHARRSHLLFQEALSGETEVGILAVPSEHYDPRRWWATSEGVRETLGELIAYLYAAAFFHPPSPVGPARSMAPAGAPR